MEALRKAGATGATSEELSDTTGIERVTISPRLRPLANKGLVIETKERRKGKSGRTSVVWTAANLN